MIPPLLDDDVEEIARAVLRTPKIFMIIYLVFLFILLYNIFSL